LVDGRVQQRVVAATNSIEEAQAISSALKASVKLEPIDRRTRFRWRGVMVDLGPLSVTMQEYGAAFVASAEGAPDLSISFPLSNVAARLTVAGMTHALAHGRSTSLNAAPGKFSFRFDSEYRGLRVMASMSELSALLAALLGSTLSAPIRFEPRVSLESGVGAALDRAARFVFAESALEAGLVSTSASARRFGEGFLLKLLEGQPHNYSERLQKIERAAAPRSVRIAADYLEANLARSVRTVELAAVTGVSARALQIGFQKHRGCTPAEFLRELRLRSAHTRLLDGAERTSIAEVARQCGFAHLGRFSARYRARFGELPTATRARAR
jgi:AraC-like DNA-binding protein